MSKETEISISVTVKDGPKTQAEKTKLPKDYCGVSVSKAINEEIVITADDCDKDHWVELSTGGKALVFVAIHADLYKFKDACGKEKPGVIYAKSKDDLAKSKSDVAKQNDDQDTQAKHEYLDGPHVYVSRPLQKLEMQKLYFRACKELFNGIADPEKKKVVINVSYGLGALHAGESVDCTPCGAATQNSAA